MYKTVRHGENSLQYTILPQTEEVLNNSGMKGKGRDFSPSIHIIRSRKRRPMKYVLIAIFGMIIALALACVPLYVMDWDDCTRKVHHEITTPALSPSGREFIRSRKKELKILPDLMTVQPMPEKYIQTTTTPVQATISSSTSPPLNSEINFNQPWIIPALRSWKAPVSSTSLPTEKIAGISVISTASVNGVRLLDHYMSMKSWDKDTIIRPTVTSEHVTFRAVFNYYSNPPIPPEKPTDKTSFEDVLFTTKAPTTKLMASTDVTSTSEVNLFKDLKETLLSVDDDDEFKESLEVDEVFSLPSIKPNAEVPVSDSDEVTVSRTVVGSKGLKWPFDFSVLQTWSNRFFSVSIGNPNIPP
ncbi:unnamed protein product [Leptidea sinapis]|uniref:Transmembrane protein n=1 Tax=Leptidea sinapis TaxID=189913 RepID=A0A5E4QIS6_9NEOP|nr:unnamed protein product [Leptidea sinapis]